VIGSPSIFSVILKTTTLVRVLTTFLFRVTENVTRRKWIDIRRLDHPFGWSQTRWGTSRMADGRFELPIPIRPDDRWGVWLTSSVDPSVHGWEVQFASRIEHFFSLITPASEAPGFLVRACLKNSSWPPRRLSFVKHIVAS
jgi:hypothetical protein